MFSELPGLSELTPDRLFARTCGIIFGAGLVSIVIAHLALGQLTARQDMAFSAALNSASRSSAARASLAALDRVTGISEPLGQSTVRGRLVRDIARLIALESGATDTSRISGGNMPDLRALTQEALALASRRELTPENVEALKVMIGRQILPRLDGAAFRARNEAKSIQARKKWVLFGSLAFHMLGAGMLMAGVALPTYRRIRDWVLRSNEADKDNRFRLLHDQTTRMPNGTYLNAFLERVADRTDLGSTQTAILRLDIDRFDAMRETLGPHIADEIVRITARRIQHSLRSGDFAAHLGEDRFVVVATNLEDSNAAAAIAERIQGSLREPFSVRGGNRRITCSIGLSLLSDGCTEPGGW